MAKGMSFKVLLELQSKEFQKSINSIKKQLQGFGKFFKSAFALGSITMFGRQVVQVGKDFENAMARVQAVSNATTDEFKRMQEEAQRLGSTTRYTATEAAGALENLTRNGMSAANAVKALSSVLQLAQANSIQLADAANIITNTLNMFNLGVGEASRVNDVLSSTASHAATDITSLYEAMVNAAPAANVLGFSIEEVSAAIGALAQRGVKGSEAGTKLRIAFQKMADPKVIAKMQEQGIEIDENTMKTEGLLKTVEKLGKANLSLGQLGKIFDAKSAMAIQMLTSSFEDLEYMLDVTSNSAGETARMFNQSVGSVQQELDTLKSMYEGLLISISQKTSGAVKGAVKLLQNLITNFETVGGTIMNLASVAVPLLTTKVIQLGTTIRTAMQAAAAGMATLKASMGGIITLVATLVTWVGTALVGAWNKANKEMKDAKKQMNEAETNAIRLQQAVDGIKNRIGDGSDKGTLNSAIRDAIRLFPEFADAINNARAAANETGEWERLRKVLQDIADLQNLVTRREAQERLLDAQVGKLGGQMWNATWGRFSYSNFGAFRKGRAGIIPYEITDEFGNLFKKHLLKTFDKDTAREIFNDIARAFVEGYNKPIGNAGDYTIRGKVLTDADLLDEHTIELIKAYNADKAAKNIIEAYGFKLQGTQYDDLARLWLTQFRTLSKYTNQPGGFYGNMGPATQTVQDIATTDSLQVAKQFEILQNSVNNGLEAITGNTKEDNEKRYRLAKDFYDKVLDLGLSDKSQEFQSAVNLLSQYEKFKPKPTPSGGGGSTSASKKTDSDYISDAIKDYNEGVTKLNNRLTAGTITAKDYERELDELEDKTWETITAFSNFEAILSKLNQTALGTNLKAAYEGNRREERVKEMMSQYGSLAEYSVPKEPERPTKLDYIKSKKDIEEETFKLKFDYAEGINNLIEKLQEALDHGDYDLVKEDAIAMLENLRIAAKNASDEADKLQDKLNLSEAISKLEDEIKNLSMSSYNTFTTIADAMDRVTSSLMSIAEIFDEDLRDSPFFQAFQAFNSVMNSSIQIMEAIMSVIQLKKQLEEKAALEKVRNTAMEVAANEAATASETQKATAAAGAAAAEAASSTAGVPIVGPALAVAAVAAVVAAILAGMKKFATGGVVGGSSYTGDKNVIRANAGEMVLTKAQQKTLFDIANGKKSGGGGQVEFKIRGADLVGTLKNYDRLHN